MAVALRRPPAGLVAHTDRGSQYTSIRYTERLAELGIAPSVGSAGDAYDNAMAEAFVGTFKAELVAGRRYPSFAQAEHEALAWIGFYNHERLHEALGDLPPAEFEENFHLAAELAALSGDLPPSAGAAHVLPPPLHGPCGPVEADRPALIGSAPAGLGTTEHAT